MSRIGLAGKRALDSGLLGKVTMAQAYWYQNYLARRGVYKPMETAQLDWKAWLGAAPVRDFELIRYARWRWFWDYGGGSLTDLYSHWGDTLHWYFGLHQPSKVFAQGDRVELTEFECPDTCNASWLYPGLQVTYSSTIIASLEGGGFILRGSKAMMKITRAASTWPAKPGTCASKPTQPLHCFHPNGQRIASRWLIEPSCGWRFTK